MAVAGIFTFFSLLLLMIFFDTTARWVTTHICQKTFELLRLCAWNHRWFGFKFKWKRVTLLFLIKLGFCIEKLIWRNFTSFLRWLSGMIRRSRVTINRRLHESLYIPIIRDMHCEYQKMICYLGRCGNSLRNQLQGQIDCWYVIKSVVSANHFANTSSFCKPANTKRDNLFLFFDFIASIISQTWQWRKDWIHCLQSHVMIPDYGLSLMVSL